MLPQIEVEKAVYPYLGPGRTVEDVDQARKALEDAYREKGFDSVGVQVAAPPGRGGIAYLQVLEMPVGRLRVKGARYYLPSQIKALVPSMQEGKVPNTNDIKREILALNQLADRRITPTLTPGVEPNSVDITLTVKDSAPLHGSVELNNRYSANTPPLRLDTSLSYNNLWQLGHSVGASVQISPENINRVQVYTGYYIARFPSIPWLAVMLQGTKQNSNVNTLGAVAVAGRGEVYGARAMVTLPAEGNFYQSLSLGIDWKHFTQGINLGTGQPTQTPTTYYPISAAYSASWSPKGSVTEMNAGVTWSIRNAGSSQAELDNNRYKAQSNFIYFRGDLSHTHDLPAGAQAFAKIQGQLANEPLVNSEQYSGGGLGTVRGYLEAEELGDNGAFATIELRSPSLFGWWVNRETDKAKREELEKADEARVYLFSDAGFLTLRDPLPQQQSKFNFLSYGIGSRVRILDHVNGSVDIAEPLIGEGSTKPYQMRVTFRVSSDF